MDKSQYRVAQVLTGTITPPVDTTDASITSTVDDTSADNGGSDADTTDSGDNSDSTTGDKPTDSNNPIIVMLNKPSSEEEANKKGMVNPSEMVYYGVMTAIMIALLAVAYNSVKTANVAKP
jgi:hypothetical protein